MKKLDIIIILAVLAVCAVFFVLSNSCTPASPRADAIILLTARVDSLEIHYKELRNRADALEKENATLKSQIAALNQKIANLPTKADVLQTFNNSPIPKEWNDVKAQANAASGQVAMLSSRQSTLEANLGPAIQQLGKQMALDYATKGDLLTLQQMLEGAKTRITALEAKIR